jgi:predicted outer membrane repeat protein
MTNRLTRGVFVAIVGLALWAIPSTAGAHGGNNDPTLLHVCIGNVNKVVRNVGVSGACIAGPAPVAETADHWSSAGIPGPKGDKGDSGEKGEKGDSGTNGTSVTFVDYFSGNQNGCPNGGAIYAAGNMPMNTYVCNGTNGIDGQNGGNGVRAEGPCFDNINRYVDCGNGTVTDTVTGLIWLKQSNCLPNNNWMGANQAAAGLKDGDCGLTDGSSAGDWRLPSGAEWRATIAQAVALGCTAANVEFRFKGPPTLTNAGGTGCYSSGVDFFGPNFGPYWSNTSVVTEPGRAEYVDLLDGLVYIPLKSIDLYRVWPVRGGPR